MEEPEILFVYTTVEEPADAERLARSTVEDRLAACVQIGAPITSVYRWAPEASEAQEATIQHETEIPLLFKTTAQGWAALEARLRAEHPYELPEIVATRVDHGSAAFLRWVESATGSAAD